MIDTAATGRGKVVTNGGAIGVVMIGGGGADMLTMGGGIMTGGAGGSTG